MQAPEGRLDVFEFKSMWDSFFMDSGQIITRVERGCPFQFKLSTVISTAL